MRRKALLILLIGCKAKQVATPEDAAVVITPAPPPPKSAAVTVTDVGPPKPAGAFWIGDIAVSSRVDNDKEEPRALMDGDLKTAWSSRTGDLEGAWVAVQLDHGPLPAAASGLSMTIGMTRTPELFKQNPRIAEVKITWTPKGGAETTIVEKFSFDLESSELQKIPFEIKDAKGVLKVIVTKVKLGDKPDWREVSISELTVLDQNGRPIKANSFRGYVGSFKPEPRGLLGIVPEQNVDFGCYAAIPSAPKVYCVLGIWGTNRTVKQELVTVERNGIHPIAKLDDFEKLIPYGTWLRVERELKAGGGKTLAKADWKTIAWGKSLEVQGVTFRIKETQHAQAVEGLPENFNGPLEVKWPEATSFTTLFDESFMPATTAQVRLQQVGALWLVERTMGHGSEGLYWGTGQAVLCDFPSKRCTESPVPESSSL